MGYAVLAGNYTEAVQWLLFRKLIGAVGRCVELRETEKRYAS